MRELVYTVQSHDVGQGPHGGPLHARGCFAPLGRVLEIDVGKRIYRVACRWSRPIDGRRYPLASVYQVESNEQRDRRLGR